MSTNNNFNLLRLLAASQVLVVHGLHHLNYTGVLLDILRLIPGVPVFFFISGLLITASYARLSKKVSGLRYFFINRFLRIYPALWVCVLCSICMVWLTSYLSTKTFEINHFLIWLFGQMTIFQFYNPDFMRDFGVGVLNGALWTITVELQFYILTPVLFFILLNHKRWFLFILISSLLINLWLRFNGDWNILYYKIVSVSFLPWIYMFMAGALAYLYRDYYFKYLFGVKIFSWVTLSLMYIISMLFIGTYSINASNSIHPISFFLLCLLILKFSYSKSILPKKMTEFIQVNDYSYGIYIYHMPILNLIIYLDLFFKNLIIQLIMLFLTTFIVSLISWKLLEVKALALKTTLR